MARRPDVGRGVEVGDERLEGCIGVVERRRDAVDDGVEQRHEVGPDVVGRGAGPSGPGVGVEDGEAHLVLVGVEVEEELLDLVDDLVTRASARSTLFTTTTTGSRASRVLRSTKRGLRQRPLGCVDQEEHAVDHGQPPLHLAAEVGVARACRRW